MRALNERVSLLIDQRSLLLRRPTPEDKNPMPGGGADQTDEIARELLPTSPSMGVCLMRANREYSVEEEHPLRCPSAEVTM